MKFEIGAPGLGSLEMLHPPEFRVSGVVMRGLELRDEG
jgi:hypothetical protein